MRIFQPLQIPTPAFDATAAQPHRNRFSVNRMAGSIPVYRAQPSSEEMIASFAPNNALTPKVETGQKFGFKDVVDVINPLQHIPVVNLMYRKATGDEISPTAQFMGGMLFGGPIGGVAAMADIAIREQTGKGIGDTMLGMVTEKSGAEAPLESITFAKRWTRPERMAGTQPVWGGSKNETIPGLVAPATKFAAMLNDLAHSQPNIS